ncbi:calmodulin-like isoform X2 [Mercenaria mercenaria]|uniref:calmodulin-like isoform X2 n=1 Tax=Mercenaria mercenaria TaxID=6596 RepID=UPI001E1DA796|nr:calmodulin-like isoform X2 [Mercenaria mercenaria]
MEMQKKLTTLRPVQSERLMEDYLRQFYMNLTMGEITDQHLKDIQDTFDLLDTDHDGRLTKTELTTLLRYTGSLKSDAEMEELLAPIDSDHNGSIDYNEFKKYIIEKDILKSLADEVCYEMQDAFNIFDKDGDGFITKDELKRVLTQIGDKMPEELADEFLKEADLNGDGKIDYQEFCKHMGY